MSFEGWTISRRAPALPSSTHDRSSASTALLAAAIIVAAIAQQIWLGLDTDVSWLLTVGEKMLDGQRLYVDVIEVNPPASVFIYLPAIVVARLLRITPELATSAMMFGLAGLSLWLSQRVLAPLEHGRGENRALGLGAALFALLLLPGLCFAQREHVALLTLLPFLALASVRADGRSASLQLRIAAGVGAGVTMAIKPHFVLAIAAVVMFVAFRRRSLRPLISAETLGAGGVVLLYGLVITTVFPAFLTDLLPMLRDVYLPVRADVSELLLDPAVLLTFAALATACLLAGKPLAESLVAVPLLAALGFAAAMAVQGKGYLNHNYPAAALALIAIAVAASEWPRGSARRNLSLAALTAFGAAMLPAFGLAVRADDPELAERVRLVAPPHPRILVAGSNLSLGHPLTRQVGGTWVGTRGALWATGTAVELLGKRPGAEREARLRAYVDEDRRLFIADVHRDRPDVVLVDLPDGRAWIADHADVGQALAGYRPAAATAKALILVRRPLSSGE